MAVAPSIKPAQRLTPRQFRVCTELAKRKLFREEVDAVSGASNGPEIMRQLAGKGVGWTCERVAKIDRDGRPCEPGLYSVTAAGRETLKAWGF